MNGKTNAVTQDPGSVDNRISWNPETFPETQKWEDGQTYDLEELGEGVTIRQISPGEGELIPGDQGSDTGEDQGEPAAKAGGYKNPAVQSLSEQP